ncbi:S1C family serine protease [Deinococcus yavapaiensis]|uniref:S1-C subfamily serine protease n=1 Tax=Deinococcus yavapaiensis KR-236 TaxID=694435 RepID=A0A318SDN4_9DEIO|nr:trypsin-like peptidase domain-containing protein [Deinococcus yavapaiensis]PYE54549.1 S1-C subfamily serine protease [Deinococcus yavapaiensis KR-236]
MRTNLILLLAGLALGGATVEFVHASGASANSKPSFAPQPVAAVRPIAPLDEKAAGTENERNTESVVASREDGLVYVSTSIKPGVTSNSSTIPPEFQPFFGGQGSPSARETRATGSGFFVDDRGDILTNNHVIEGATSIKIRLKGRDQEYKATVVGAAPQFDLAVIRAEDVPRNLVKPIPLGDSDKLRVGQKAIAMGAPFDLDFSVTEGIVSAVGRKVPVGSKNVAQSVIQTDAAINPGNSGGPLLNSAGEVVGINTQIISPSGSVTGEGQFAGVGFAIPVNTARRLLPDLAAGKDFTPPTLGFRYLDLSALPADVRAANKLPSEGLLVQDVLTGSPAGDAGVRGGAVTATLDDGSTLRLGGDVVTAVDGRTVASQEDLQSDLLGKHVGDTLKLTVRRGAQSVTLNVKLRKYEARWPQG